MGLASRLLFPASRLASRSGIALAGVVASGCGGSNEAPKWDAWDGGTHVADASEAGAAQRADSGSSACCGDAGSPATPSVVLQATPSQVPSIAAGTAALYFSESCPPPCSSGGGTLWTRPIAGGSPAQLPFTATSEGFTYTGDATTPTLLTVDGSSGQGKVWFLNAVGLNSIGIDGTGSQVVATSSALGIGTPAWGLAVDADNVYVLGDDPSFDTVIVSVAKSSGTVTPVATVNRSGSPTDTAGLVVDAHDVYWCDSAKGAAPAGLFTAPKSGGGAAALLVTLPALSGCSGVAIAGGAGDAIYMAPVGNDLVELHTAAPNAAPVTIATSATAPFLVAGEDLYFTAAGPSAAEIRRACAGGPGTAFAQLAAGGAPTILAASANQLFIAGTLPSPAQPTGTIWSTPR